MTLKDVINKAYLLIGDDLDKRHASMWLFLEYLGIDNSTYYLHQDSTIDNDDKDGYFKLLDRYINENIPVQYLIGHSYFYGRKFNVSKDTLIPRSETDYLVKTTLDLIYKQFGEKELRILDLGTGSGAIGITLKLERPSDDITISDISVNALTMAKKNASKHNVIVDIIHSSWFDNIEGEFDVIVANPPYVSSDYEVDQLVAKEPNEALYGGSDGLDPYRIILKEAKNYLKDKSIIAFEHGYDHKEPLNALAKIHFPNDVIIQKQDLGKRDRYTFIIRGDNDE